MSMRLVWLVCVVLLAVHCSAVRVELLRSAEAKGDVADRSLWHPAALTRVTADTWCFVARDRACNACAPVVLCSFDGGRSVVEVLHGQSSCLLRGGVAVNDSLLCPTGAFVHDDEDVEDTFSMPVTRFVRHGDGFVEHDGLRMTVRMSGIGTTSAVEAGGAVLQLPNAVRQTRFLMPVAATHASGAQQTYLVHSSDGLHWHSPTRLPSDTPRSSTLYSRGEERLVLVSHLDNGTVAMATSGYLGRYWSALKPLPTPAPPAIVSYPLSGVRLEYATHNNTGPALSVIGGNMSSEQGSTTKIALPDMAVIADAVPYVTLCDTSASPDASPHEMTAVYDGATNGAATSLRMAVYVLDDTAEAAAKEQLRAKVKKEAEERAEAAARLQTEMQARMRKEKRERRRKELAQRRAFRAEDATNVQLARHNMEVDGELIIVRKVGKYGARYERQAFFNDV